MVLVHFLLTLTVGTTQHMTTGVVRLINCYMYLVQSSKITKAFLMSLPSAFCPTHVFYSTFNVMAHSVGFKGFHETPWHLM